MKDNLKDKTTFPLLRCSGTVSECGEWLGEIWRDAFHSFVEKDGIWSGGASPWWKNPFHIKLIEKFAPHLPDLFRSIAKGAGLPEDSIGGRIPTTANELDGCTSFALSPNISADGNALCGQTKDTPADRMLKYRVLSLRFSNAPSLLTLTYPGWLFGHGFVDGGCALFRNSLFAGEGEGRLGYAVWGLLASHCSTADKACELAEKYGVGGVSAHCLIQDSAGDTLGVEIAKGGVARVEPAGDFYVHTNHVLSNDKLRKFENAEERYFRDSEKRLKRLSELLADTEKPIDHETMFSMLSDHSDYPYGICNHAFEHYQTTAAVVAEPALGILRVTHGPPCSNLPETYHIK